MALFLEKRPVFTLLTVLLIFTVTGAFTFSFTETLNMAERKGVGTELVEFIASPDQIDNWLFFISDIAEKPEKQLSFSTRSGGPRESFATGAYHSIAGNMVSSVRALINYRIPDKKNDIHLILRT